MGGYLTPAQEAGCQISGYLEQEIEPLKGSLETPIFHYTSYESMLSIIESGTLRANSLNFMNDPVEIRYAASIFRACLDRRIARSSGQSLELLTAMQSRMHEPLQTTNVYSVSFSTETNDSALWNLYADRGRGFAFSMSSDHTKRWLDYPLRGALHRCQYGEGVLTELCIRVLNKTEELFDKIPAEHSEKGFGRQVNPEKRGFNATDFSKEYLNEIACFAPVFKPAIWQDERELRYVFIRYAEAENPRFLELKLSHHVGAFGISSILAGPRCDQDRIDRIRLALDQQQISDCPVISAHVA